MTGIIILAAGASSRLGRPKQQLLLQGGTLLQRAVRSAVASACQPVVVVLGANAETIAPSIASEQIHITQNNSWDQGMASSVKAGLQALLELEPNCSSVLLMLCDQPFVDTAVLHSLLEAHAISGNGIVACNYGHTLGAPVLFSAHYFKDLLALEGQEGARKLLHQYPEEVASVLFPKGAIDIDTVSDYLALVDSFKPSFGKGITGLF